MGCQQMQPTRTFTWYNSVESVSRRASMCWNYAMMSPSDTSLVEEERVDVDWANRDGAGRVGATESICCDLNCVSLRFTLAVSMAQIWVKWSDTGKWMKKWCNILVKVEGKMRLLQDVESRWTSIINRMKWEGKSIVRCSRKDNKNRARSSVMEL